ncbi:MAG: response regulator [Desulfobacterales bacterium]|nr:response regulator [Desulfobacterales bacterium]
MTDSSSFLSGKRILAVDDEIDILETIEDILDEAVVDTAGDYAAASSKIKSQHYDLAILDIMGVNGLQLLEETVAEGIPTVMLTAHAVNPEALMESIQKGAISYLPKEKLAELDDLLELLLDAHRNGEPPWKLLFEKLGAYFNERFGEGWQAKEEKFWLEFNRNFHVSKGIQERLLRDKNIMDKGI